MISLLQSNQNTSWTNTFINLLMFIWGWIPLNNQRKTSKHDNKMILLEWWTRSKQMSH